MSITVGIAGITGKFGGCVVRSLLKYPAVNIRGYCRNPSKLLVEYSSSPRVEIIQGEWNDEAALTTFVKGTDVVMCCYLGDNNLMTEGQKLLIDACEAEAVPRYIASDYTLDFTKLEYGEIFNKDPMKHVMEYLKTKRVEGVHILVGAFLEVFWGPFLGIFSPTEPKFSYWGTGNEPLEATTYGDAAEYAAAVALDPSAVGIKRFLGDKKSILEIAATFEEVYGQKPKLEHLGSLEDVYTTMKARQQADPANIFSYMPLNYIYYCFNGQTAITEPLDNDKYPSIKPLSFKDYMKSRAIEELASVN